MKINRKLLTYARNMRAVWTSGARADKINPFSPTRYARIETAARTYCAEQGGDDMAQARYCRIMLAAAWYGWRKNHFRTGAVKWARFE